MPVSKKLRSAMAEIATIDEAIEALKVEIQGKNDMLDALVEKKRSLCNHEKTKATAQFVTCLVCYKRWNNPTAKIVKNKANKEIREKKKALVECKCLGAQSGTAACRTCRRNQEQIDRLKALTASLKKHFMNEDL